MDDDRSAPGPDRRRGTSELATSDDTETVWNWPLIIGAIVVVLVVAGAAGIVWLRDGDDEPVPTTTTSTTTTVPVSTDFTLAELLPLDGQYATFLALADQAGILDDLKTEELTVLAPDVDAFKAADINADDTDEDTARSLVRRHLLPGSVTLADLIALDGSTVENVDGQELAVEVDGNSVTVGGATITKGNIEASNGQIHVVSGIVRP